MFRTHDSCVMTKICFMFDRGGAGLLERCGRSSAEALWRKRCEVLTGAPGLETRLDGVRCGVRGLRTALRREINLVPASPPSLIGCTSDVRRVRVDARGCRTGCD